MPWRAGHPLFSAAELVALTGALAVSDPLDPLTRTVRRQRLELRLLTLALLVAVVLPSGWLTAALVFLLLAADKAVIHRATARPPQEPLDPGEGA